MNKIKLLGMGNVGSRSHFTFKKSIDFFPAFFIFLKNLDLDIDKPANFYAYDKKILDLNKITDTYEHTENKDYDIDFFFGKDKIIVVIRSNLKWNELMNLMKEIADFKGFDND